MKKTAMYKGCDLKRIFLRCSLTQLGYYWPSWSLLYLMPILQFVACRGLALLFSSVCSWVSENGAKLLWSTAEKLQMASRRGVSAYSVKELWQSSLPDYPGLTLLQDLLDFLRTLIYRTCVHDFKNHPKMTQKENSVWIIGLNTSAARVLHIFLSVVLNAE